MLVIFRERKQHILSFELVHTQKGSLVKWDRFCDGKKRSFFVAQTTFCSQPKFYDDKITFCPFIIATTLWVRIIKTRKAAINLRTKLKVALELFLIFGTCLMLKFCAQTDWSCRVKIRPITDHKFFKLWGKISTCTFFARLRYILVYMYFHINTYIYVIKYKVTLSLIVLKMKTITVQHVSCCLSLFFFCTLMYIAVHWMRVWLLSLSHQFNKPISCTNFIIDSRLLENYHQGWQWVSCKHESCYSIQSCRALPQCSTSSSSLSYKFIIYCFLGSWVTHSWHRHYMESYQRTFIFPYQQHALSHSHAHPFFFC